MIDESVMRKSYARWIARAVTMVRDISTKEPELLAKSQKLLDAKPPAHDPAAK